MTRRTFFAAPPSALAAAAALACTFPALPVHAQAEAPPGAASAPTVNALEAVQVVGQRASNRASVEAKRDQRRVMDAISSDETRQLPDRSVAESARRIPGVSVTFNADNQNGRDEAQRPVIRGLDARYNNSTVDGGGLASADANNSVTGFAASGIRGARLDLLPSSMIRRLEVFKTWTPDQDANAVGGSINVVTRSAFDDGGRPSLTITGALGDVSNKNVPFQRDRRPARIEFGASRTFGADRMLGVVVSGYDDKVDSATQGHMTTDSTYYNWYDGKGNAVTPTAATVGGLTPVPQQNKFFYFQNQRERRGLSGKFEIAPTRELHATALLGSFQTINNQQRYENFLDPRGAQAVANQTPTSGDIANGSVEVGLEQKRIKRTTRMLQLGAQWTPADDETLSLQFTLSKAEHRELVPRMTKYLYNRMNNLPALTSGPFAGSSPGQQLAAVPALGYHYDTSGFEQQFTLNSPTGRADYTNLANYNALYFRTYNRNADNLSKDLKIDWRKNLDEDSRGLGYAVGLSYQPSTYDFDYNFTQNLPVVNGGLTLAGVGAVSGITVPHTGGLPLLLIDMDKSWQQYQANLALTAPDANNTKNSLQDDYAHRESTRAAYAMVGYGTERLQGLAGVRVDSTKQTTAGWSRQLSRTDPGYTAPNVYSTQSSDYTRLLPALSLNAALSPSVKLRSAVTRTLGRPDYSFYPPQVSVTETTTADANGKNILNVNIGNPDIKPRKSTNYDLSLEWYQRYGLASVALFHKDIVDEIFAPVSRGTYAYGGETRTADIARPVNSPGARMDGVELAALVDSFAFLHPALRGFGMSANATFIRASMQVPLNGGASRPIDRIFGQPDRLWNLTGFYTFSDLSLRATYNHTGKSLRALDPQNPWQDVFWKERNQLDLSARLRLGSAWTTFVEVQNAGRNVVTSVTGPRRDLLKDTYAVGRTVWVGATYAPKLAN